MRGTKFCRFHGGKSSLHRKKRKIAMGFYSKRVSKTLQKLLEEAGEGGPQARMDLAEEVDLSRANAERALKVFDTVCLNPDTKNQDKITDELRIQAQSNLRDALTFVSDMVGKYGKMLMLSNDLLSGAQVKHVVDQVVLAVTEVLGEDHVELPRILARLENLKAPDKDQARHINIINIS